MMQSIIDDAKAKENIKVLFDFLKLKKKPASSSSRSRSRTSTRLLGLHEVVLRARQSGEDLCHSETERHAGDDCNEAITDWRKKAETATTVEERDK